jgi:hypothetical protein
MTIEVIARQIRKNNGIDIQGVGRLNLEKAKIKTTRSLNSRNRQKGT